MSEEPTQRGGSSRWRGRFRMRDRLRSTRAKVAYFTVGGLLAGVVITFVGLNVLESTDSPEFCSSCHIMDSAFGSFTESNHAHLDCNDCHAPTDSFLTKMTFKARTGAGHIYYNTIGRGSIPDVLHATTDSVEVVNRNCITCHEPSLSFVSHDAKETCSDCHRSVPHGRGMYRPDEWHEPMQRTPVDETIASQPSGGG
jgi:cytochrome c nitrite reductase small subunit